MCSHDDGTMKISVMVLRISTGSQTDAIIMDFTKAFDKVQLSTEEA